MRRWIVLVAQNYPRAWRERYGVEFDALMEDVEPDWREFTNVLGGAVKLQLQSGTALWKLAGVMALVGMVVAAGLSLMTPGRYVSTARLRMTTESGGDAAKAQADQDLGMMLQGIFSRGSLAEMIHRPSLSLYREERQRIPMEDVIQKMRRDIRVLRDREGAAFSVSFIYPDRFKAQAVVRELTAKFLEQNVVLARNRENIWQTAWKEHAPPGGKVELAAPATDPRDSDSRLSTFLAWGLGVGTMLGVLSFAVVRQPRVMRQLALCGLAGCALGGAASFLIPELYVSNAVMRITPPLDPKRWYAGSRPEPAVERVERMKNAVWGTLKNGSERDVSVQIFPAPPDGGSLHISATASSAIQAHTLVREVVSGFIEQHSSEERALKGAEMRFMAEHKIGPNLEVLDPASVPASPARPNRSVMAGLGLLAGLLAGAVMAWRRRPDNPEMSGAMAQPI